MKKVCLFITGMLLMTLNSIAQQKIDCCQQKDCCKSSITPPVTKGYYAIGDNAKKLNRNTAGVVCSNNEKAFVVNHQPLPTKGYYAIAPRQDSLSQWQPGVNSASPSKIDKGFFAIGNNQQKIDKGRSYINGNCSCDCR